MPLSRLLEAPLRKVRVTVPGVVGIHSNLVGCPAVTMKPGETLGGFADEDCAATAAQRQATNESGAKYMLTTCVYISFGAFVLHVGKKVETYAVETVRQISRGGCDSDFERLRIEAVSAAAAGLGRLQGDEGSEWSTR